MRIYYRLNPITRKRLRRFRELRRADWSFWALVILYLVSLISELLCNSNPLYVRFEGKLFFPIFKYYPDDTFTGSGNKTRPDYKALSRLPIFAANPDNTILFPPFRYGPFESIAQSAIDVDDEVVVSLMPESRAGTVNVDRDFRIARSQTGGFFFGVADGELEGRVLTDHWALPETILAGVHKRFRNETAPAMSADLLSNLGTKAIVSLSRFNPRRRPPPTVRVKFREPDPMDSGVQTVIFTGGLNITKLHAVLWDQLTDADKNTVISNVHRRIDAEVPDTRLTIAGQNYRIVYTKRDIRFPFRPVKGHPLGIDSAGRDVFARVLYGLRTSMTFGLLLVVFSMVLGIAIGAVQGYYGGLIDITGQRLIEIWSALPFLYVMILLASVYGTSFLLLLFCYGIFNWIGISYYMRAEFLRLRSQPFVEAAKCMGVPNLKIIVRHILPNSLVPVVTFLPFSLVGAIGVLTALDYLGYGLPPPTPSWGDLLKQAQEFRFAWWLVLYPSLALFIVMVLTVFVGEGVRTAFDPKRFSRME